MDETPLTAGDALWRAWDGLMERVRPDLAFFGPDWYRAWFDTLGREGRWTGDGSLLAVRDRHGDLHGVLPTGLARLGPLLVHGAAGSWYPTRPIVAARGLETDVGRALGAYVAATRWPLLRLGPLPAFRPEARAFLDTLRESRAFVVRHTTEPVAMTPLPPTWRAFVGSVIGRSFGKSLDYFERRLARDGRVRIEHVRRPDPEATRRLLDDLAAIESRSWLPGGDRTRLRFTTDSGRHLWRRIVDEVLSPRDQVDCWVVYVEDEPASYLLCMTAGNYRCLLFTGYDQRFRKRSVGSIVFRRAIQEAIERGLRTIDFGGQHLYYKKRWGAEEQGPQDTYLVVPHPAGRHLARMAWAAGSLLRKPLAAEEEKTHP